MRKSLIVLALVAGCGASDRQDGNAAAPVGSGSPEGQAAGAAASAVATAGLTGLYEGGSAAARSELCILDKGPGNAQFGIKVAGAAMLACQGAGSAVRAGDRLTLKMSGDQPCTVEATIRGGTVSLARSEGSCDYYCGGATRFDGVTLTRTGARAEDALRARDVVGEPLCSAGAR